MTAATPQDPYDAIAGVLVPLVSTPVTESAIRIALIDGHHVTFGREPSFRRLAVAWAMVAGECNRGKAVHNFNLCNIGLAGFPGDWTMLTAREIIDGQEVVRTQPIRSHSCAEAGAVDYWDFLAKRCTLALMLFDYGDMSAIAHALKTSWRYTEHEEVYARSLWLLGEEYVRRWPEGQEGGGR